MSPSIRLGRIFGIEVGFNWSLIFVFAYIAWVLASSVLPSAAPGHGATTYWIIGLAGAILFYACLLAHELAHAVVARSRGIKVGAITLWLFGGVSSLESEPASPGTEALVAGVGPITSLAVAGVSFAVAYVTTNDLAGGLFSYLFFVNLALAIFNLVPAFPLDGGRLLSSVLWWRAGSRQRGVHQAVRVASVFAYLMIAGGVALLFFGQPVNGIWLAFIGWFLLSAGTQEEAGSTVRTYLQSIPVSAAMTSPVVTLPDWVTVEQFLESIAPNHSFTTYPVHDPSGKLTGVVRLRDLVRLPSTERAAKHLIDAALPIGSVPTTNPREELLPLMRRLGPGLDQRVLVFDGGQLVGILSPADVARVLSARQATASAPRG
ncbi:MAG TPA: site-2 protease family protein [Candidatus Dormibacteraeota bacterium]|nr:site-2 protease family protein [Candidatus Dormibacteraeota bacterium]